MKKQILLIAVISSAIVFASCSKEKLGSSDQQKPAEVAAPLAAADRANSLSVGLEGYYTFDANLHDKTGKLTDAVTTLAGNPVGHDVQYVVDRKGYRSSAIHFTGDYGAVVFNLPITTNMSLATWVKYDSALAQIKPIAFGNSGGPGIFQYSSDYFGYNSNNFDNYIDGGAKDNKWHLLVVTMDGTYIKFYIDASLVGTKLIQGNAGLQITNYTLGYNGASNYWSGSMDDLRFYSRTLSSKDVTALYNL